MCGRTRPASSTMRNRMPGYAASSAMNTPAKLGRGIRDEDAHRGRACRIRAQLRRNGHRVFRHRTCLPSTPPRWRRCAQVLGQALPCASFVALPHTSPDVVPKYTPAVGNASAVMAWRLTVHHACDLGMPSRCRFRSCRHRACDMRQACRLATRAARRRSVHRKDPGRVRVVRVRHHRQSDIAHRLGHAESDVLPARGRPSRRKMPQ